MNLHFVIFSRLQSFGGGRETWLNNFLVGLDENDFKGERHVYYYKDDQTDPSALISQIDNPNVNFHPISLPSTTNKILSLIRILIFTFKVIQKISKDRSKSSIVSIGSFIEPLAGHLIKMITSRKVFTMIWLRGIVKKESAHRHNSLSLASIDSLETFLLKRANFVIANGNDTAAHYKKTKGIDSIVIANGVRLDKFQMPASVFEKNSKIIISYIGRLSLEKGFDDYLKAIELFNNENPLSMKSVCFHVVGNGPLLPLLDKYQYPNLEYKGPISHDEMPNYLSTISAGVALTKASNDLGGGGVSNGLVELMAAGKLIICWENIIFTQVLNSDSASFIQESDFSALSNAFSSIQLNSELASKQANSAQRISKNYSFDNHMNSFLNLISQLT